MVTLSNQTPSLQENIESTLLEIVRTLLVEGGADRAISALGRDAAFESDLGLGSLERVELLLRIESAFSIRLPDTTIAEAQTVRELASLVLRAAPSETSRHLQKRLPELKGSRAIQPSSATTLTEALLYRAEQEPERPHIYLPTEQGEESLSYGALLEGAQGLARGLRDRGLAVGETVAIMLPSDRRFFECFFGVLIAGGIPVPVYPPFRPDQIEDYARRQTGILKNAGAVFLITFEAVERLAQLLRPMLPTLRGVTTVEALRIPGAKIDGLSHRAHAGDLALIQYTSGSTADPKGVALSHHNLISNIKSMAQAMEVVPGDAGVSWLPLYHDMGLIGAWFFPLYSGIPVTILPPFSFLSRPESWLWAIHSHRATISPAPNFAYELCAAKIKDEAIEGLDLSAWRIALNGAEPIKPETLTRFTKRFAPYGFRPEAFLPVYGMAEASVGLAFSQLRAKPKIDRVSRTRFERDRQALVAGASESSPIPFISCGVPLPGHEVRIVDDQGKPLPERVEGNLVFKGPSCTSGYYRNPEATASLFQDGWLCSGDLAYWAEGELYITGRKKDLIIKGGRNLHPHEIEGVVGEIPGIRKGCVAAFGVPDQSLGTEKLVVVAETRETAKPIHEALRQKINKTLVDTIGSPADFIALSAPGTIPKTSSGKIAHRACRAAYLEGSLSKRRGKELQFVRLILASFSSWAMQGLKRIFRFIYGAYLILLLPPLVAFLWVAVMLSPKKHIRGLLRGVARLFLSLSGLFPHLQGESNLRQRGPVVWVSNHASYTDALFLTAILPANVRFVAKQELLQVPILRTFLSMGQHITVDRGDVSKGASATEGIETLLKSGESVLIFPEGTFLPAAGLRPFKLGAFKAAVEAGVPVCSIALRGTRRLLRDGRWLPDWHRVNISVGKATMPEENVWREVVRLRDHARKEIGLHCGEDLLKS